MTVRNISIYFYRPANIQSFGMDEGYVVVSYGLRGERRAGRFFQEIAVDILQLGI